MVVPDASHHRPDASHHRRLAVVTGAFGGIGYELAKQFAAHDFDLILAADHPGIHEASRDLAAHGVRVQAVQVDLAEPSGVEVLWGQIGGLHRPVDAAAINAGLAVHDLFATETDLDAELRLINRTVLSSVYLARLLLVPMVHRGAGRLLITSVAAMPPGPYAAVYSACRAFLDSFTEATRLELKDTGVTVTALLPEVTDAPLVDKIVVAQQGFEALVDGTDRVASGSAVDSLEDVTVRLPREPVAAPPTPEQRHLEAAMRTRARALGHSIHPMLVVFPLGLFTAAVVFDAVQLATGNDTFSQVGFWNIVAGVIGAALAAVTGLIDWLGIPNRTRARTTGLLHGCLNAAVTVLFLIALLIRADRPAHAPGAGLFVIELLALGVGVAAAWLGGELVERHGIGVDENAHPDAASSLRIPSGGRVRVRR